MLIIYVSLNNPLVIAFLNLPISTKQRSSLWSRRTRRELRDLARSSISDDLRRRGKMDGQGRVLAPRINTSEERSMASQTMSRKCHVESPKLMLMLDGSKLRHTRHRITPDLYGGYLGWGIPITYDVSPQRPPPTLALDFRFLHKLKVLEINRDNLMSSSYVKMYSKSSEAESPRRFQPQTRSGIL